jgi:GMP synthase-like glutamine amidotransferase
VFWHCHCWDITEVLPGIELLVSTDERYIQLARQAGKPVYGRDFGPEMYAEEHLDGARLLDDFFTLAGLTRFGIAVKLAESWATARPRPARLC